MIDEQLTPEDAGQLEEELPGEAEDTPDQPEIRYFGVFTRLLPIGISLLYLTATVLLFAFGPWPWPVPNGVELYVFLTLSHVALLLGYLSAIMGQPRSYAGRVSVPMLLKLSLLVSLIMLIPTSLARSGSIIPDVMTGLQNPGMAYDQTVAWLEGLEGSSTLYIEYLRILLSPLLFLLFPLSLFYWQMISWPMRLGAVFCTGWIVCAYLAMGVNKYIADVILLLIAMVGAGYCARYIRAHFRHKALLAILLIGALGLFLLFFTSGQLGRHTSGATSAYINTAKIFADQDHPLVSFLPTDLRLGVIALSSYITQGYWGLSLSLQQPFVPTFGFGNSLFLLFNVAKIPGLQEVATLPYPMRVEMDLGIPFALYAWSSIYPWIASDVTFPGTILIVFLIGRLLALTWLDTLQGDNPFAVAMFAELVMMIVYFPANNQCLQSGEGFVGFYFCLGLWLFTRRRIA